MATSQCPHKCLKLEAFFYKPESILMFQAIAIMVDYERLGFFENGFALNTDVSFV